MKRYLILLLSVLSVSNILNATPSMEQSTLVITGTDGKRTCVNLNERPIAIVNNGELIVKTSAATFSYSLADVARFTYEPATSGLPESIREDLNIFFDNDILTATGLRCGAEIRVYSISGIAVREATASDSRHASLSLSDLRPGIYIVEIDSQSFKILKK